MKKTLELIYDTLIFSVVMLIVMLLFTCAIYWIFKLPKANGAPAPFSKRERTPYKELSPHHKWYGTWYHKYWYPWTLHFNVDGTYSAISTDSIYEGTWKIEKTEEGEKVIIEEYPVGNPQSKYTWTCYPTDFSRAKSE